MSGDLSLEPQGGGDEVTRKDYWWAKFEEGAKEMRELEGPRFKSPVDKDLLARIDLLH
jgi:hypothetical protein